MRIARAKDKRGFSLVELLVVCAIIIVVLTLILPNMAQTIAIVRLRGNMSSLAGLYQNGRMQAVRQNAFIQLSHQMVNGQCVVYTDSAVSPQGLSATPAPPQLWLSSSLTCYVSPPTGSAPFKMDDTNMCTGTVDTTGGIIVDDTPGDNTSFSPVGLPCSYTSPTTCPQQAFIYYFNYSSLLGAPKWGALAVSPAGRIKACYWNGTTWGD